MTQVHAQAFETLLVSKLDQVAIVQVADFQSGTAGIVDLSTGGNSWRTEKFDGSSVNVPPHAIVVLTEA